MMEEVSLREIAMVFNGKTPPKTEQRKEGHPVLKIRDVTENGEFRGSFESFVDVSFAKKHERKRIHTGDVLILNAAHNSDYVGSKQFKASADVEGSLATGEWLIARSADPRLSQDYLWHWLQSPTTRFAIKQKVKGIHLYPRDVADLAIPLPPIPEQRRIAAILDKASTVRQKRNKVLALADDLVKSMFFEMFGDPAVNPKVLPTISIGELIKLSSGSALIAKDMAVDGPYPVYGGNGINGFHSDYMFEAPQVVIGRVGVYCGVVHITRPRSWVTDNALYVREYKQPINQTYLEWALRIANLNQYAGRAAQPLISGGRIYPIEILLPDEKRQEVFADFVLRQRRMLERLELAATDATDLAATLSQWAFRGEL